MCKPLGIRETLPKRHLPPRLSWELGATQRRAGDVSPTLVTAVEPVLTFNTGSEHA